MGRGFGGTGRKNCGATVEACVLERSSPNAIRYRPLAGEELKELAAA